MKYQHSYAFTARTGMMIAVVLATTLSFASWTSTGSMSTARASHAAVLLSNGLVLVAGGVGDADNALTSIELYNSASGTWASTGDMNVGRVSARAVLLPNGTALVIGGCIVNDCLGSTTKSAKIYTPSTGKWTATGSMLRARAEFSA